MVRWKQVSGVLITTLMACSPGVRGVRSGRSGEGPAWLDPSNAPAATSSTSSADARALERWDWDLARQAVRPTGRRARSRHFTGEFNAEVLAAGAGAYPRLGPSRQLAVGATLVERVLEPEGGAVVVFLVMVKRTAGYDPGSGDWEYLVVAPSGQVEQRGPLPVCARCHAEAPHDHLFGGMR